MKYIIGIPIIILLLIFIWCCLRIGGKMNIEEYNKKKNKRTGEVSSLAEANIKLMNKLKWIREDIQREIYKLKYTDIDDKIKKEEIINDLEKILKVNN